MGAEISTVNCMGDRSCFAEDGFSAPTTGMPAQKKQKLADKLSTVPGSVETQSKPLVQPPGVILGPDCPAIHIICVDEDRETVERLRLGFAAHGFLVDTSCHFRHTSQRETIAELIVNSVAVCCVLSSGSAASSTVFEEAMFSNHIGRPIFPFCVTPLKTFSASLDAGLHMLLRPTYWTHLHAATIESSMSQICGGIVERINAAAKPLEVTGKARQDAIAFFETAFQGRRGADTSKRRKRVTKKPIFISYPRSCKDLAMSLWKDLEHET